MKKLFPTHFLCLPLVTSSSRPLLIDALATLRRSIEFTGHADKLSSSDRSSPASFVDLRTTPAKKVPAAAIRPADTLHLTIGVLHVSQLDAAMALFEELDLADILQGLSISRVGAEGSKTQTKVPEPLLVSLRDVRSMQDNSGRTAVLYAAPADTSNRLQAFSEALREIFVSRKAMLPDQRPLLLHATLVNTIYVYGKELKQMEATQYPTNRKLDEVAIAPESSVQIAETVDSESADIANVQGEQFDEKSRPQRHDTPQRGKRHKRFLFDASDILASYADCTFTPSDQPWRIEKVAICKMGAKKYFEDGVLIKQAYEELAEKALP